MEINNATVPNNVFELFSCTQAPCEITFLLFIETTYVHCVHACE